MNIASIVFIIYMIATISLTVYCGIQTNKVKNKESYVLAGRSLIWPLVAFGSFGAAVGGTATVGAIENVYLLGVSACVYGMCRGGSILAYGAVSDKIRSIKHSNPCNVFAEVFTNKDGKFYTIVTLGSLIGVTAVQIMAAAAVIPSVFPAISIQMAIIICALLFGGITLLGGFLSVSWTNVINTIFILLGILICLFGGLNIAGGWGQVVANLPNDPKWLSFTNGGLPMVIIIAYVISLIPKIADSPDWIGLQSAKTGRDAKCGYYISGLLQIGLAICVGLIGLIAVVAVPGVEKTSTVFSVLAVKISPFAGALAVAGIYAAATSCAQAWILSAANVINSLYKDITKKEMEEKKELAFLKILVVLITVASYAMATQASSILTFAVNVTSITAPFGYIMFAVFYYPKMLRKSTASMTFYLSTIVFVLWFLPATSFIKEIFPHIAYPMLIASILAIGLPLLFDKNKVSTDTIYINKPVEASK